MQYCRAKLHYGVYLHTYLTELTNSTAFAHHRRAFRIFNFLHWTHSAGQHHMTLYHAYHVINMGFVHLQSKIAVPIFNCILLLMN